MEALNCFVVEARGKLSKKMKKENSEKKNKLDSVKEKDEDSAFKTVKRSYIESIDTKLPSKRVAESPDRRNNQIEI